MLKCAFYRQAGRRDGIGAIGGTQRAVAGRQPIDVQRELRRVCRQFATFARLARPECHLAELEGRGGDLVIVETGLGQCVRLEDQTNRHRPTQGVCDEWYNSFIFILPRQVCNCLEI